MEKIRVWRTIRWLLKQMQMEAFLAARSASDPTSSSTTLTSPKKTWTSTNGSTSPALSKVAQSSLVHLSLQRSTNSTPWAGSQCQTQTSSPQAREADTKLGLGTRQMAGTASKVCRSKKSECGTHPGRRRPVIGIGTHSSMYMMMLPPEALCRST